MRVAGKRGSHRQREGCHQRRKWGEAVGWMGEINTLEELEALMCGNVLPETELQEAFYRLPPSSAAKRLIIYLSKVYMRYHIE